MRFFCYDELTEAGDSLVVVSDEEIYKTYYPYWKEKMQAVGKDPNDYVFEDCLNDWIAIHWAWESFD
jgi:hypothetical protein